MLAPVECQLYTLVGYLTDVTPRFGAPISQDGWEGRTSHQDSITYIVEVIEGYVQLVEEFHVNTKIELGNMLPTGILHGKHIEGWTLARNLRTYIACPEVSTLTHLNIIVVEEVWCTFIELITTHKTV